MDNYKKKYFKYKKKYLNLKYDKIGGFNDEIKYIGNFKSCEDIEKKSCYEFNGIILDKNDKKIEEIYKKGYWEIKGIDTDGRKNITFTDTLNKKVDYSWKPINEWRKVNDTDIKNIKQFYKKKDDIITSGFLNIEKAPIHILTWNICWECMTEETERGTGKELGKKCLDTRTSGNGSCYENVLKFINRKKYDFIGLQEASKWYGMYNDKLKESMGYIHNSKLNELVTFYNKNRFIAKYAKFGQMTSTDDRPYQIIFFEDNNTNDKYILINLHNNHYVKKEDFKNSINNDIINCFELDANKFEHKLNEYTDKKNIKEYIDKNNFNIIALGDFNDNGADYWKGLNLIKNIKVSSSKKPPITCCDTKRDLNKTKNTDFRISDYILISDELKYIKECNVPTDFNKDSNIYPTSDHLPVEATIDKK